MINNWKPYNRIGWWSNCSLQLLDTTTVSLIEDTTFNLQSTTISTTTVQRAAISTLTTLTAHQGSSINPGKF